MFDALSNVDEEPSGNGTYPRNNQYPTKMVMLIPRRVFQLQLRYRIAETKNTIPILWSTPGNLKVSHSPIKGK